MRKNRIVYNMINISVVTTAVFLFQRAYGSVWEIFDEYMFETLLVMAVTVIIVHSVKAGRLYLSLYGSDMDFHTHLKIYCKVIPVSVIFPLKLGEFFRMYCYGRQLENVLKGTVIILLDRVMDTTALVTMLLLVRMFSGGHMTLLAYILIIFLAMMLIAYCVFPGIYRFWKKHILRAPATEKGLAALKMLEMLSAVYLEIEGVVRGKGIILYFMSLVAWGVEIGSVILLNEIPGGGGLDGVITGYLMSALGGGQSVELARFVFASIVLLMVTYIMMKFNEGYRKRRKSS